MRNKFVVAIFTLKYHPWYHVRFMNNYILECEIKVSLLFYCVFYWCHTYKLYKKLQDSEFSHPAVSCDISVGEKHLDICVNVAFLVYM